MRVSRIYIYPTYENGKEMFNEEISKNDLGIRIVDVPAVRTNSFPLNDELFYDIYRRSSYNYYEELSCFIFLCINKEYSVKSISEWQKFIIERIFKENKSIRYLNLPKTEVLNELDWKQACYDGEPIVLTGSREGKDNINIVVVIPSLTYVYQDDTPFLTSEEIQERLIKDLQTEVIYDIN